MQNRILFEKEDTVSSFESSRGDDFYERIQELAAKVEREVTTMISNRASATDSGDKVLKAASLKDTSDEDVVKLQKAVAKMKQLDKKLSDLVKVIYIVLIHVPLTACMGGE